MPFAISFFFLTGSLKIVLMRQNEDSKTIIWMDIFSSILVGNFGHFVKPDILYSVKEEDIFL